MIKYILLSIEMLKYNFFMLKKEEESDEEEVKNTEVVIDSGGDLQRL